MKFPTDSLYKFMGIFGIILFLGTGWLYYKTGENVTRIFDETRRGVKELSESQRMFLENTSKLMYSTNEIAKGDVDKGSIQAKKIMLDMDRHMADDAANRGLFYGKLQYMAERDMFVTSALGIISMVGLLMALCGVFAWYFKLQIYIDKKIKSGDFSISLSSNELEVEPK